MVPKPGNSLDEGHQQTFFIQALRAFRRAYPECNISDETERNGGNDKLKKLGIGELRNREVEYLVDAEIKKLVISENL